MHGIFGVVIGHSGTCYRGTQPPRQCTVFFGWCWPLWYILPRYSVTTVMYGIFYGILYFFGCHFLCFVFNLSSSCDIGEPGMGSAPLSFLGSSPIAMLLVPVYLILLFPLIVVSSPSVFLFRCVLHPLPLPLSSCLGCIPPLIGLPSLRFYAVASSLFLLSVCFCLVFLFYRDDTLCWLLPCPFSSVCFPCLSPIPGLIWFGSVLLVTTAGFVADQLM